MPGVRIDYRVPQVEVLGEVVLRQGALELFAYSQAPTPKEHETILRMKAAPRSIHEALGLIGLRPGRPIRYDRRTRTLHLPTGDAVDVLVRYSLQGATREASACEWMLDLKRQAPMGRTHWVFSGSQRLEDGTFYADIEGTVVTVVDFPSAVLSLPRSHSDSDAALWLGANTEAIPPVGTPVTLILRPAGPGR